MDVPERLWHYTTTPGLLSIVRDKRIWATDAMYLNDSRELLEGAARLAFEADAALEDPSPIPSPVRALWLEMRRGLSGDAKVQMPEEGPFVTCFCSEGDLLSQWRGYSSGSGYAIGFSESALRVIAKLLGGSLSAVIYGRPDPHDQSLFLASAMTYGQSGARLIPGPGALASYKHPAFREEQEWRLVVPAERAPEAPALEVNFRSGMLGVTPYLEIPFGGDAIVAVRVGPGGDQELRRRAVQRMLEQATISATTSTSEAPFRG